MDQIVAFLAENYPWLLATLTVAVVAVWGTVHVMKRLNDIKIVKSDLDALKSDANCKVHKTVISNTQDDLKLIKDDLKSMLSGITSIKTAIVSIKPTTASLFAQANSPLQLNDKGRQLFASSGAEAILSANAKDWIARLHEMGLKTALDVEEQSRLLLLGMVNEDVFIPLKNYVYNHPRIEDISVSMEDICFVMSLELRNLYLNEYPDILPEA